METAKEKNKMKLKYVGPLTSVSLYKVNDPNAPEGSRGRIVKKNEVFECTSEVAAELLSINRQHRTPIFVEASELKEKLESSVSDFLDDTPVKNKMKTPEKKA